MEEQVFTTQITDAHGGRYSIYQDQGEYRIRDSRYRLVDTTSDIDKAYYLASQDAIFGSK